MSKHNSAHLSPIVVSYNSNGSGRDSYIGFNCGGLLEPSSRPTQYSIGSFREKRHAHSVNNFLPAKHVHYHSDGTGRDNYIVVNEGGLIGDMRRPNYLRHLREYPKNRSAQSNDYLTNLQFLPTLTQALKKEKLYKEQTQNTMRLSQPRFTLDPYKKDKESSPLPGLRRIY